jgi:plastocyanin
MGMYGAMIVDPKGTPLQPAREFVLALGEYDSKNTMNFDAEYFPVNGYADQYMAHPLVINEGELARFYIINLGTTIPAQFHIHSTDFVAYPSGLLSNNPIHAQTFPVGPGDATIIEAKWQYPGKYMFHSHGIQEERGNMGEIMVVAKDDKEHGPLVPRVERSSISMFEWQHDLQKKLQNASIITYGNDKLDASAAENSTADIGSHNGHNAATANNNTFGRETISQGAAENVTQNGGRGNNGNNNNNTNPGTSTAHGGGTAATATTNTISIVDGAANPTSEVFFNPPLATATEGQVTWVNNDTVPHTASSKSSTEKDSSDFDSGIIGPGQKATVSVKAGTYEYYCMLHPYMTAKLNVIS